MSKKEEKKHFRIFIFIILLILIIAGVLYLIYSYKEYNKNGMEKIFGKVEEKVANLTEYIVYGTHLNLKGTIDDELSNVTSVNLILAKIDGTEEKVKLQYEENVQGILFYTSDLINKGIDLEKISLNKHYMIIEVQYEKNDRKYYTIENKTEYDEVLYYTITRNNSNNKIDIKFENYQNEQRNFGYMLMDVKNTKLPKDIYDVVVDPGHGGSDKGAEYGGYSESDLTLEYSKKVKTELEKLGLKVKITRDGTEDEETFGTQTVYDRNGRVNVVRII